MRFAVTHSLRARCSRDCLDDMLRLTQSDPDVKGYRGFINFTEGRGMCVFDAPDKDHLVRWLDEHDMSYDDICEVEVETERGHQVEISICTPTRSTT